MIATYPSPSDTEVEEAPVRMLRADLKAAAALMPASEIRYLVDLYYQVQDFRKAGSNQRRAALEDHEPSLFARWIGSEFQRMEGDIRAALDTYTDTQHMGRWAKSIVGIGPVLSAGLLAHIDIEKAPTAGHIWRFAGLDPTVTWGKGQKRPWNAQLKVLCWKLGESFIKVQKNPKDIYGHLYIQRRAIENAKSEAGDFADQAAAALKAKRYGKDTVARQAYEQGKLPDAQLHARASRWAVKLLLAHWQAEAWRERYGTEPPLPYAISILGHAHMINGPR